MGWGVVGYLTRESSAKPTHLKFMTWGTKEGESADPGFLPESAKKNLNSHEILICSTGVSALDGSIAARMAQLFQKVGQRDLDVSGVCLPFPHCHSTS